MEGYAAIMPLYGEEGNLGERVVDGEGRAAGVGKTHGHVDDAGFQLEGVGEALVRVEDVRHVVVHEVVAPCAVLIHPFVFHLCLYAPSVGQGEGTAEGDVWEIVDTVRVGIALMTEVHFHSHVAIEGYPGTVLCIHAARACHEHEGSEDSSHKCFFLVRVCKGKGKLKD